MLAFRKFGSGLNQLAKNSRSLLIQFHKSSFVLNSQQSTDDKGEFSSVYENRNPRNLEWSGHQYKRFGWNLQYPPKDFYHRCLFEKNVKGLTAKLLHASGEIIIDVSTNDPEIKEHLYSTKDVCAAMNLARVFADRCLQYGIVQIDYFKDIAFDKSEREQTFYKTLIECGLKLEEPAFVEQTNEMPGLDYENVDFFHEKRNVPFPPDVHRLKREKLKKLIITRNSK